MEMTAQLAAEQVAPQELKTFLKTRPNIIMAMGTNSSTAIGSQAHKVREELLENFANAFSCDLRHMPHDKDSAHTVMQNDNRALIVRNVHAPYQGIVDETISFEMQDDTGRPISHFSMAKVKGATESTTENTPENRWAYAEGIPTLGGKFRIATQKRAVETLAQWIHQNGGSQMFTQSHEAGAAARRKKARSMMLGSLK